MKRLLCILSGMNAGGAETFLMKVYRQLDKTQYQMDFCVNSQENFYAQEIESLGGRLYQIPPKSQSVKAFTQALSDVIRQGQYEYVLRITSNAMGFMDLKVAKKAGAKRTIARSSNSSDGQGMKFFVAHRLGRLMYRRYVDVKAAPSDLAGRYTFGKKDYEQGRVTILNNAVDLAVFRYDDEQRATIRREFGIDDDTLVVGHVGRFDPQKNHAFLVDIFAAICQKNSSSKLMLVGKGDLREQIQEKIARSGLQDRVIFTGVRKDVPAILSAMDVFVFPSFYEGMPNTVIEAQACGVPCIIADTITASAKITDVVEYRSLQQTAEEWADAALAKRCFGRHTDTHDLFRHHGYDIESMVDKFTKLVFDEK